VHGLSGVFESFEHRQAEDDDIKSETEPGQRDTGDRGVFTRENVRAASRDVTWNRAGVSLDGKVKRIHHSDKRKSRDRNGPCFHL
jgi:hypothetical protein